MDRMDDPLLTKPGPLEPNQVRGDASRPAVPRARRREKRDRVFDAAARRRRVSQFTHTTLRSPFHDPRPVASVCYCPIRRLIKLTRSAACERFGVSAGDAAGASGETWNQIIERRRARDR